MQQIIIILVLASLMAGCVTKSQARAQARQAYFAGETAALQRMQTAQIPGVTVVGPVQNSSVPWVTGLTLAQAIATANYQSPGTPSQIILTRSGEDASIDPNDLDRLAQFTLQPGDVITLKQ